ncbi:TQO small subunit DoxD [Rufibacter psychrotolerans]|uniref:TQO small subunit DoxD n=1 Tax=Rufibacter psychrotolerans TaxID=2812556 RepID=UPI001967C4ED|nr:TQO small subunit DoxD [Rufibacter sp. SYSU D00308]
MKNTVIHADAPAYSQAGLFTLSLRLVVGWTYFSAFWRRLVLENKLDPETAGYIGEKFNHFLPNALGIKPLIEYLVSTPESLWVAMASFTIIEGVVGLLFMLGFLTRLMSLGVLGLAMGILLGAGWLGTTCLDEWQIGVLGIAAGFTIYLTGSGPYSLDHWLARRTPRLTDWKWFRGLGSGVLPVAPHRLPRVVLVGSLGVLFMTLFTNQYFHGGVWGDLHNKSVKPKIEIAGTTLSGGQLSFEVYRVEGADVYGSFLIGVRLENEAGAAVLDLAGQDLANFPTTQIRNAYVAKVKPGAHSLVIPLGAKATLTVPDASLGLLPAGTYKLTLTDISGAQWTSEVVKEASARPQGEESSR